MDQDLWAEAADAVARRHPDLSGEAFAVKVRRVVALMRYSHHGPTWTAGRGAS